MRRVIATSSGSPRPTAARFNLDRVRNVRAHESAAAAGVAPAIVASKLPEAHYLARFIAGPVLSNDRVHRPGVVAAVGRTLRGLHGAAAVEGDFSAFDDARRYLAVAIDEGLALPDDMDALMLKVDQIERTFDEIDSPACLCHNDLVPQNIIETADGMRLIDFEFAGMGEPVLRPRELRRRRGAQRGGAPRPGQLPISAASIARTTRAFA